MNGFFGSLEYPRPSGKKSCHNFFRNFEGGKFGFSGRLKNVKFFYFLDSYVFKMAVMNVCVYVCLYMLDSSLNVCYRLVALVVTECSD